MSTRPISDLEKKIGHSFKDQSLLTRALTHSSTGADKNYERLEFLGDRVLGLAVSELLYRKFPEEAEGNLARRLAGLVEGSFLARMAESMEMGSCITFSISEKAAGGAENDNILADVREAVIGALYLDAGFETCRARVENLWADHIHVTAAPPQHPKTTLQEWAQGSGLGLPEYDITGQSGPDHAPVFEVTLRIEGYANTVAQGGSRQQAEKEAALAFLKNNKVAQP